MAGRYEGRPTIELEDELIAEYERMCSAHARLVSLAAELERREAYKADGARTMSDWLSYRLGVGDRTAREWCGSARSLEFLPAIEEAYSDGFLSWDKVKALTDFCTPEEDAQWAEDAMGLVASQVRRYALHRKRLAQDAADARFKRRYLKLISDPEEGVVRIWGRLPDAHGALVKKTIERMADQAARDPETGRLRPLPERCADALVELASLHAGADDDPDRANIVVHADASTVWSSDAVADLEGELAIAAETLRRLMCDGRVQTIVHDTQGNVVAMGEMTRTIPPTCTDSFGPATADARGPDAPTPFGCTRTTWCSTPTAGRRSCPTCSRSARTTTSWCTKVDGACAGGPVAIRSSSGQTEVRCWCEASSSDGQTDQMSSFERRS